MPILPENRHLYPENWQDIRASVRERAGGRCERCGVHNKDIGYRLGDGTFVSLPTRLDQGRAVNAGRKVFQIICTTAHLDHDPTNNDMQNLLFLCQRCHNQHDAPHRAETRRRRLDHGQTRLF